MRNTISYVIVAKFLSHTFRPFGRSLIHITGADDLNYALHNWSGDFANKIQVRIALWTHFIWFSCIYTTFLTVALNLSAIWTAKNWQPVLSAIFGFLSRPITKYEGQNVGGWCLVTADRRVTGMIWRSYWHKTMKKEDGIGSMYDGTWLGNRQTKNKCSWTWDWDERGMY